MGYTSQLRVVLDQAFEARNEVGIDRPPVIYLPEPGRRSHATSDVAVRRVSASQAVPLFFDHTHRRRV